MAYKGGYYKKPVKIDFGGLASMYTQGKIVAETTREGVRKERGQQLSDLQEASDFEITGIEDWDKVIHGGATLAREALLKSHKENIAGTGTRTGAASMATTQAAQMQMLGKMSEMAAEKVKTVSKSVADGKSSQAELENLYATFLKDAGQNHLYIDANGEQQVANRSITPVYDNKSGKHGIKVKQDYVDQDGELQTFEGVTTYADITNPRNKTIKQITVLDKSNELVTGIGKREFAVGTDGAMVPQPYFQQVATGPNGQAFLMRPITQEMFPDMRNYIETNINGISDDEIVSMLYSMNGKTVTDGGFQGYRDTEFINDSYKGLYDNEGNPLTFDKDPLVIERNSDMSYNLSEGNRALVGAYVRNNSYKAMDVTSEEVRTGVIGGRSSKTNDDMPLSDFDVVMYDEQSMTSKSQKVDRQWVMGTLSAELLQKEILNGNDPAGKGANALNEWRRNGNRDALNDYTNNIGLTSLMGDNPGKTEVSGLTIASMDKAAPDLANSVTSIGGFPFSSLSGMIAIEKNDSNGVKQGITIHLSGQVDIAVMENNIKSGGGSQDGQVTEKFGTKQESKSTSLSTAVKPPELRKLWGYMYDNNTDFRNRADSYAQSLNLTSGKNIQLMADPGAGTNAPMLGIVEHWGSVLGIK